MVTVSKRRWRKSQSMVQKKKKKKKKRTLRAAVTAPRQKNPQALRRARLRRRVVVVGNRNNITVRNECSFRLASPLATCRRRPLCVRFSRSQPPPPPARPIRRRLRSYS